MNPLTPDQLIPGTQYRILTRDQNPNADAFDTDERRGTFQSRNGNTVTFRIRGVDTQIDSTIFDIYPVLAQENREQLARPLFGDAQGQGQGQGQGRPLGGNHGDNQDGIQMQNIPQISQAEQGPSRVPGGSPARGGSRRNNNKKSRKQQQKRKQQRKTRQRRQRSNRTRRLH